MTKLVIGYFYKKELNLYGDNGNVEVLIYRARKRNIPVEVIEIASGDNMLLDKYKNINLAFMGGGPDSAQNFIYEDLIQNKKEFLKTYIENKGVGLFICGSYQLLGNYYKDSSGKILKGLEIFKLHTEHFGNDKQRCIGNTIVELNAKIKNDPVFKSVSSLEPLITGFENHGGQTFLEDKNLALGKVIKGHGNNRDDYTEGILYNNSIGTYFHGPFLVRNPHIADFLLAKSLNLKELEQIEDTLQNRAFTASKKLK